MRRHTLRLVGLLFGGTAAGCDGLFPEPQAPYTVGTDYTYTLDRTCSVGSTTCDVPQPLGPLRIRVDADTVTSVQVLDPSPGADSEVLARAGEHGVRLREVFSISKGQGVRDLVLDPERGYPRSFRVSFEWIGDDEYVIRHVDER